jgi:hypothetical protein
MGDHYSYPSIRFAIRALAATLMFASFLSAVTPASAGPFYVLSSATATTSGNIPNGQSFTNTTQKLPQFSVEAGPFHAVSSGTFYGFDATADTVTELGAVHGSATVFAQSTGPAGGATATAQGQWSDTITITSNTLPNNTPVQFLATIILHRTITGSGATASADVTGPFGLHLLDSLSAPNPALSASVVFNTFVGQVLSPTSTLTINVGGSGIAPFAKSGAVHAENTAVFHFEPITAGASYTTASGITYVPEPATFWLAVAGVLVIGASRLRKARTPA